MAFVERRRIARQSDRTTPAPAVHCLLGRHADDLVSALEDNQETLLEDLQAIDFSDAPRYESVDQGGRRKLSFHVTAVSA